jgi:hypothetical protein
VRYALAEGLELTVRAGSHGTAGACTGDGVLMIDLSGMRRVDVDPATRRASVEGGALLADLDAAAQAHGLATPAGMISHTGVGGLTLGGGMGWLTRKHGLSVDNLVSAEIVTADGVVRTVSADQEPDLFWALRGGGGAFGVVTRFEFALHPVGPMVDFGMFSFGVDQGAEALRLARDLPFSLIAMDMLDGALPRSRTTPPASGARGRRGSRCSSSAQPRPRRSCPPDASGPARHGGRSARSPRPGGTSTPPPSRTRPSVVTPTARRSTPGSRGSRSSTTRRTSSAAAPGSPAPPREPERPGSERTTRSLLLCARTGRSFRNGGA